MLFPQMVEVGFYHELNDRFALLAMVDWEDWSAFKDVPISVQRGTASLPTHFDDTYKLAGGIHFRPSKPWLLMTGVAYDSNPVDSKDRQASLPLDRRYAVGTRYQWSERLSLGENFEYIDLGKAKIDNDNFLKGDFKQNEIFFVSLNADWKF